MLLLGFASLTPSTHAPFRHQPLDYVCGGACAGGGNSSAGGCSAGPCSMAGGTASIAFSSVGAGSPIGVVSTDVSGGGGVAVSYSAPGSSRGVLLGGGAFSLGTVAPE